MAFFESEQQLYDAMTALFARLEQEMPAAAESMLRSRLMIRLKCTDPTAVIVIDARERPLQTSFGHNSQSPDLNIKLAADTLHQIMLGEQSLRKALGQKKLVVSGPVWKSMALADLFRQAQTLYPAVLQEQGLENS